MLKAWNNLQCQKFIAIIENTIEMKMFLKQNVNIFYLYIENISIIINYQEDTCKPVPKVQQLVIKKK